jgi:hypothetical protein
MARRSNLLHWQERVRRAKAEVKRRESEQRRQQKRVGPAHDRQPERRP